MLYILNSPYCYSSSHYGCENCSITHHILEIQDYENGEWLPGVRDMPGRGCGYKKALGRILVMECSVS